MKLILKEDTIDNAGGRGLEIIVPGFKGDPSVTEGSQVFIDVYEDKLEICVWDGSSEDAEVIKIDRLPVGATEAAA